MTIVSRPYTVTINSTVLANAYCSRKQLDELKPITFREMGERKIYEGHFLFCEVLKNRGTRPAIYDEMVVIDTNGDPSIVGLGFVTCAFGEVFSEGTILAIKVNRVSVHRSLPRWPRVN